MVIKVGYKKAYLGRGTPPDVTHQKCFTLLACS